MFELMFLAALIGGLLGSKSSGKSSSSNKKSSNATNNDTKRFSSTIQNFDTITGDYWKYTREYKIDK